VPEPVVLQKLLTAGIAASIVESGADQVGGYVTTASSVAGLRTPTEILTAYGVSAALEFVDVVRFEQPVMATFYEPTDAERPWETFPTGFLLGDSLARVWTLGRTRYSYGAEYWRIRSDGAQKRLSRYEGVARGWVGARRWRRPSPLVGTLARWRGREFFADLRGDSVLLSAITDDGPAGFEEVHPGAWSVEVPTAECEVFERVYTAEADRIPVRVLSVVGHDAEVMLLSDDPDDAAVIGAGLVEPGVYELVLHRDRLSNLRGIENQLVTTPN
jgi:hypothetical protein